MSGVFEETWFYAPLQGVGDRAPLSEDEAFHMRKVLRLKPGDSVVASNGCGSAFVCEILAAGGAGSAVELSAVNERRRETRPPRAHLVMGLLKGRDAEDPVEAVCQLPLRSVQLVTTDFTQDFKGQEHGRLMERLRLKSLAGLKQAKKTWLTELHPPLALRDWRKKHPTGSVILAHPGPDRLPTQGEEEFYLLTGPEGGFSSDELAWLLKEETAYTLGLGDTRIRAVHAPLLACGKLMGLGWM